MEKIVPRNGVKNFFPNKCHSCHWVSEYLFSDDLYCVMWEKYVDRNDKCSKFMRKGK